MPQEKIYNLIFPHILQLRDVKIRNNISQEHFLQLKQG